MALHIRFLNLFILNEPLRRGGLVITVKVFIDANHRLKVYTIVAAQIQMF